VTIQSGPEKGNYSRTAAALLKAQKEGFSGSRKEKNNALVDKVKTVVHRACFIPSL